MYKNANTKSMFSTRVLVMLGLMIAMEIILERVIAIPVGNITRFSIGKTIVILSGLWFGPVNGAVVGAVSDILGGILQGYGLAINPLITLSSMMWGIIPALVAARAAGSKRKRMALLCGSIVLNCVVSTLFLTTLGLMLVYGYSFYALIPTRLAQAAALTPTYCIVCCMLYFSPLTGVVLNYTVDSSHAHA